MGMSAYRILEKGHSRAHTKASEKAPANRANICDYNDTGTESIEIIGNWARCYSSVMLTERKSRLEEIFCFSPPSFKSSSKPPTSIAEQGTS